MVCVECLCPRTGRAVQCLRDTLGLWGWSGVVGLCACACVYATRVCGEVVFSPIFTYTRTYVTRRSRSSGVVPRTCVRVYARVLVPYM